LAINGPFPEEWNRSIDKRRSLDLSCNSGNFSYFEFADASVQRLKVLKSVTNKILIAEINKFGEE